MLYRLVDAGFEIARALGVAAMIAATGTWFGRPLDGVAASLALLAAINLVAALATRAGSPRMTRTR